MGVSSNKNLRSITLPPRSHPSTDGIQKVLNKIKTWESTSSLSNPSAEIICNGFSQLTELYVCLDELVQTYHSQTSNNQTTKWTDELLDASVKFLDIFSNTTQIMLQTKEEVRSLGCDLRRKGVSTIAKYVVFRSKLKKEIKESVASLKKIENTVYGCHFMADSENYHLMSVIRAFREVKELTIVIFRSLFVFLGMTLLKTRTTGKWRGVSRFLSNSKVVPEEDKANNCVNELKSLDEALFRYKTSDKLETIQNVQTKLESLEAAIDDINSHIELMSRRLISTRVSLLNMVSLY